MNPDKLEKSINPIICRNKINPRWDNFISSVSGCNIEQTSVWGTFECSTGMWNEHVRIILQKDNQIIGGAQILLRDYIKNWKIGFIQQGPNFKHHNLHEAEKLIKAIKSFAKSENLIYITFDVAYNLPMFPGMLKKHNFSKKPYRLPPITIIDCTNLLDLSQDLDSLMGTFSSGRRKSIRSGQKQPLKIRTGGRDDIELFFNLVSQTCKRLNTEPFYTDIEFYYKLWDLLSPKKWIVMHIASLNKQPICATLGFAIGDTFRNSMWGATDEMMQLNASSLIDWNTIVWAKTNGFLYYDFVQLDSKIAAAIESKSPLDEKIKNSHDFGTTFYKLGYGGRIIYYPGNFTYYPNLFVKLIISVIFKPMVGNGIGLKAYRLIRRNILSRKW